MPPISTILKDILQPTFTDVGNAISDVAQGNFASALTDITSIPDDIERAFGEDFDRKVNSAVNSISQPTNNKKNNKRRRTGEPVVDGLVGVESNPGPGPNKPKMPKPTKKGKTQKIGGKRHLSVRGGSVKYGGQLASFQMGQVRNSYTTGRGAKPPKSMGTKRVLGSQAHIFSGTCAFQNLATDASNLWVFQDSSSAKLDKVYLNPRICCQNTAYNTPAGLCPIGVIAQPFRRYTFLKCVIRYVPTNVGTSSASAIAFAFDPEVIATSAVSTTTMAFANFEASVYGPVWAPLSLDLTPWMDHSRWFYGETPATIATSLIAAQSIQGTLMCCSSISGLTANSIYGLMYMDYTLALNELGPTEVFTGPAFGFHNALMEEEKKLKELSSGKDEMKTTSEEVALQDLKTRLSVMENAVRVLAIKEEDPDSPYLVEENPLTKSIHIPKSTLSTLLANLSSK